MMPGPVSHSKSSEQFQKLKPKIESLVRRQRQLINDTVSFAEKHLDDTEQEEEVGRALLMVKRGGPKNNRFMKLMQYPEFLKSDLENRIRCCDIVELHFNEGLVRDFIALVHELAAISDRIEVVLMPRNYEWVKNPPEALDRQRTVVTRIERETGAAVRDYQHLPELDGRYFLDVSHLILHEGQDRFSRLLAEDWAGRF